ncbi:MAG TPA: class I SAM-dependent methyltransferase [Polyangiaceae bacterium]|nr:class I SAM-dependent methyltransferase [Polyangiaceae bacterium]
MLNLKRLTGNHASRTLAFFIGLRKAESTVTPAEHALLVSLSQGKNCIVEVGVFEGVTSKVFCRAMNPSGRLYLVDPYFPETSIEKLLNVSFTRWVAAKSVSSFGPRSEFVRKTSSVAATSLPVRGKAELIFIDARHDYDSVLEDFRCWSPLLAAGAAIAFHDSHVCAARPDLTEAAGPVRLMTEIAAGKHGPWTVVDTADSVTVVRRQSEVALAS